MHVTTCIINVLYTNITVCRILFGRLFFIIYLCSYTLTLKMSAHVTFFQQYAFCKHPVFNSIMMTRTTKDVLFIYSNTRLFFIFVNKLYRLGVQVSNTVTRDRLFKKCDSLVLCLSIIYQLSSTAFNSSLLYIALAIERRFINQ